MKCVFKMNQLFISVTLLISSSIYYYNNCIAIDIVFCTYL